MKPYSVGGSSRLGRWVGRSKGYAIQLSLAKQAAQQRHEGGANEGDTAAGHELLHALAFRAGVVRAITFQQVDAAHTPRPAPRATTRVCRTSIALLKNSMVISSLL